MNTSRQRTGSAVVLLVLTLPASACDGVTGVGGHVIDAKRRPIAGAVVTLATSTGRKGEVITREDGRFRVGITHAPVLCGDLRFRVSANGFADHDELVTCKTNRTGDIVLVSREPGRAP